MKACLRSHSPGGGPHICLLSELMLRAEGDMGMNHELESGVNGLSSNPGGIKFSGGIKGECATIDPCYSKCGPGTCVMGITWEFVRKAEPAF